MANWTPGGFIGKMFKTISRYIAPSGMPSPLLWGDEGSVRERLSGGIAHLEFARRTYPFEYPFPPEEVVDFFRANYGPMSRAFASLTRNGQEKLRSELVRLWSEHNHSGDNTTRVDAEYLEVIATRRGERRAESLAERIEEGAAGLAAFVEGLSEEEWRKPVSETDRRSVGVVVHHVATVYPIEIDLARAIAGGNAVTEVTWEVVSGLNAQHAQEQAGVTREATLELLKRNSRGAAAAVRGFTDEELDRAAPFGLSFGAPVTAQFVIEDHALRHSWHHLAKIRKALGKVNNRLSQVVHHF